MLPGDFVSADDGTGIVHTSISFGEDDYRLGQEQGHRGHQPGPARRDLRRAHGPVRRPLGQGGRRGPRRGPARRAAGCCARRPTCTPTRTAGAAARRCSTTPSRPGTSARRSCATACWPPTRPSTGTPSTSSTGASGAGSRTTSTGRSRASATGARRCRSGAARTATRECMGSFAELAERSGETLEDPHRPYVDTPSWPCADCGEPMRRVPEVIDVWFDSGCMPFAQHHAPFENQEHFEQQLPRRTTSARRSTRRAAGSTRCSRSRRCCSTARPTRRCCASGTSPIPRARRCRSRWATSSPPWEVIDRHGADAFRWYFLTSKQPWDGYLFSTETVGESVRQFLLQLWNTYGFYVLYANVNDVTRARGPGDRARPLGALAPRGDRRGGARAPRRLRRDARRPRDRGLRRRPLQLVRAALAAALLGRRPGRLRHAAHLPRHGREAARPVHAVHRRRDLRQPRRRRAERAPVRLPGGRRARRGARVRHGRRARDGRPRAVARAASPSSRCASRCAPPWWSPPTASARRSSGSATSCREELNVKEIRYVAQADELGSYEIKPNYRVARPALRQADAAGRRRGRVARPGARRRRAARRARASASASTATTTTSAPTTCSSR